jgi:hypothetical protein
MRKQVTPSTVKVWLSANDTYNWAHRPGQAWPCSQLSGRRVFAEFDSNGLIDVALDGKSPAEDVDVTELNACMSDHIGVLPAGHPAHIA